MKQQNLTHPDSKKLSSIRRKPIKISENSWIVSSYLKPGQKIPLVIEPTIESLNLLSWAQQNRKFIEENLSQYGAILWRNFSIKDIVEFEQFIQGLWGELRDYTYRSTPRSHIRGKIYTSPEYPAHQTIPLHNEMAYCRHWPLKIAFFCQQSAQEGGETPIADSRKILKNIAPEIIAKFEEKGIMYVRNYVDGLDLSWQNVFQTTERTEVENYCLQEGIEWIWKSGNCLRTTQICQAVIVHPQTQEEVWFNQAHLFHISSLEPKVRQLFLREYRFEDLPRNAYYGDGTPIEDSVLEEIRQSYQRETIVFPWQSGDILMLDNLLTAHGRMPYVGQRKVVVCMV